MTIAYIGLGSNMGDRWETLRRAVGLLGAGAEVGPLFETSPVGGPVDQPDFLNSVARIETPLSATALLRKLLEIEAVLGRVRGKKCGPRAIDMDLLLFGSEVVQSQEIVVPHPRLHERGFVLAPLAEIASESIHPILELSIRDIYAKWVDLATGDKLVRIAGPEWVQNRVDLVGAFC